jgi:hypothetical protein
MGTFVIGTVSNQTKARAVFEAGADQVFFYSDCSKIENVKPIKGLN